MRYRIGQSSRLGNRNSDEDRCAVTETAEGVLLVLADGVGSSRGGAAAAEAVVRAARECYLRAARPVAEPRALFTAVVAAAHEAVRRLANAGTAAGAATTAVLCLLQEGRACWTHVGDSRIYLFRNGIPLYRSEDHSYVEGLLRQGVITAQEAEAHPLRGRITRCIGFDQPLPPTLTCSEAVPLAAGDIVLLCSDGFWTPLDDAAMGASLQREGLDGLEGLAELAESESYPKADNITALAVQILHPGSRRPAARQTRTVEAQGADPLRRAIAALEEVLEEYREEMKR